MNILRKLFGMPSAPSPAKPARDQSSWSERAQSIGIPATPEMVAEERRAHEELLGLVESSLAASGVFLREKVPELMLKLRRANAPFQHPNIDAAFAGDTYLSANEKRKLGLNTRMKYSHTFIACCDPASLGGVDPKGILNDLYVSAHHAVSRKQQLTKFRKCGVGKVRVSPCGKPVACATAERLKRFYVIDQAPALPLTGCDARCCQCLYEPVIDELE